MQCLIPESSRSLPFDLFLRAVPETFFVVSVLCFASHDVEGKPDRNHFGPNNPAIELDIIPVVHSDLIFDSRHLVHDIDRFSILSQRGSWIPSMSSALQTDVPTVGVINKMVTAQFIPCAISYIKRVIESITNIFWYPFLSIMVHFRLNLFLFVAWKVLVWNLVVGEVVPFIEPGFFFSYGSIPVTEQCETVRLIWGRQSAIGQNPVAPYFFQVFTSSFVFPFVVNAGQGGDAGDGNLFFDFTVPFAPGTQYQICMYDSNGLPGGCQVLFTMIQNSTDTNPTCKNMTMPNQVLDVNSVVDGGPMSQNGFINQCDNVSIQPLNGTPPFTLTVSPPNHPPYNITSLTMDPIVWTVSLSRAMPFFLSLVSSEGLVWANGPMGVGRSDDDTCLAPDTILKAKAHSIATGAGVGGLFGGLFLAGVAWIVQRCWSRRRNTVDGKSSIMPWYDGNPSGHSSTNLYIRHQDGGRGTSPRALPEETTPAEVVELPPKYVVREDALIPHMLTEKPLHRLLVASE
ncbi:hypothetical protein LENED_005181 [Lentinula edodes]|uniref:Uncharacterized protein n=1 Tax=Lentinula edodes TaxID=5353 RepID=A0A1Q3E8A9_LENED|nr:hypothetical protein LENED_005181 [Lentinula edodes]